MIKLDWHYGVWEMKMINRIKTDKAPSAIGTYSQGSKAGNLVFTSGQIAINPITGEMVTDDFSDEVRQVLNNVKSVLEAGGSSLNNIIKLTVFLTDLSQFNVLNTVFEEFFPENPPARSALEVSALPKNVNVEIEAIGVIDD